MLAPQLRLPEVAPTPCERCGASLELTALVGHVTCGHCGHRGSVAPARAAALQAYQAAVAAQLPAIVARLGARDLWAHRGRTAALRTWLLVAFALLFLLTLFVGWPAVVVLPRLGLAEEGDVLWVALLALGVALGVLVLVTVVTWSGIARRARPPVVELPQAEVRCSACGAPARMDAGHALGACGFCRAVLVASRDKVQAVARTVGAVLRRATLERHAAEREIYAPKANLPLLRRTDSYYQEQRASAYASGTGRASAAWFGALAAALGGELLDGDGLLAWLNARWPAKYAGIDFFWGHPRHAVALVHRGYPVLLDAAPAVPEVPAALRLLVATDGGRGVAPDVGALSALGFSATPTEAGLEAFSAPGLAERVRAAPPDPQPFRQLLDAVVDAAARSGHAPLPEAGP